MPLIALITVITIYINSLIIVFKLKNKKKNKIK